MTDQLKEAQVLLTGSEKKLSLSQLVDNLRERMPLAMASPTTRLQADWYFMVSSRHEKYQPEDYHRATVILPFSAIDRLSEEEFLALKREFRDIISSNLRISDIPTEVATSIDPNSPTNILEHERDHLKVFPLAIREHSTISVTFIKEPGKDNKVRGIQAMASPHSKTITPYDWAISCSEPKSLNSTDIETALNYADKTGDKAFIRKVKQRIKLRLKHIGYSETPY